MLRLTDPEATHRVPITVGGEETVFFLKSMNNAMRLKWLGELQSTEITPENAIETYPRTLELVARQISGIEGYETMMPLEVLELLEHQSDLMDIIRGVIGFSQVSETESKNSESSSEGSVSTSASVGTIAETGGERVLTITEPSESEALETKPEDKG